MNNLVAKNTSRMILRSATVFGAVAIATSAFSQTLSRIDLSPSSVLSGNASVGTVVLSKAATKSTTIPLVCSVSTVTIPGTVVVPSGKSTIQFPILTKANSANQTAKLSATYSGKTVSANLNVKAVTTTTNLLRLFKVGDKWTYKINAQLGRQSVSGTLQMQVVNYTYQGKALKAFHGSNSFGEDYYTVFVQDASTHKLQDVGYVSGKTSINWSDYMLGSFGVAASYQNTVMMESPTNQVTWNMTISNTESISIAAGAFSSYKSMGKVTKLNTTWTPISAYEWTSPNIGSIASLIEVNTPKGDMTVVVQLSSYRLQ